MPILSLSPENVKFEQTSIVVKKYLFAFRDN